MGFATAAVLAASGAGLLGGGAYVGHEMMADHPEISADSCTDMSGVPVEDAYLDESVAIIQQAIIDRAGIEIIGGADGDFEQASCIAFGMSQEILDITIDYRFGSESAEALGVDMNQLFPKEELASDADIDNDVVAVDNTNISNTSQVDDIECRNMEGELAETAYTYDVVTEIQTALDNHGYGRGGVDGKFLDLTCDEVVAFQTANGLEVDGIVGPATALALGIDYSKITAEIIEKLQGFDPNSDCPIADSCDIEVNLKSQRMIITDYKGNVLWDIPVQSGKKGYETRNVNYRLGAVEYGEGGNPERPSIDYPEAVLVNPRAYGGGGQKIHGSYSFNQWAIDNPNSGSAGCIRVSNDNSYIFAEMPAGTDVIVHGAKPGTAQL